MTPKKRTWETNDNYQSIDYQIRKRNKRKQYIKDIFKSLYSFPMIAMYMWVILIAATIISIVLLVQWANQINFTWWLVAGLLFFWDAVFLVIWAIMWIPKVKCIYRNLKIFYS